MRKYLEGGDLRTIGGVKFLLPLIRDQKDFDILFRYMYSKDRPIVMRAADAVEKLLLGIQNILPVIKETYWHCYKVPRTRN